MSVILTGAGGGIGGAIGRKLIDSAGRSGPDGWRNLTLVDLNPGALDAIADDLRVRGANVLTMAANLAESGSAEAIVAAAIERFGRIDSLISNAGAIAAGPLMELSDAAYDLAFDVNTKATWALAKTAYPHLRDTGGTLVAIASISAEQPTAQFGTYSPSKSALLMLVRQLSDEWGPEGLRCNCVSPGATETPMTAHLYVDPERRRSRENCIPLRRIGQPQDIANAVAFLASEEAAYITGANLVVDGGVTNAFMALSRGG